MLYMPFSGDLLIFLPIINHATLLSGVQKEKRKNYPNKKHYIKATLNGANAKAWRLYVYFVD